MASTNAAHWLRSAGQPVLGWFSGRPGESGVLIVGPIAYEYWTTYRSVRELAERLGDDGHHVLRIELRGLGDSAGDLWDHGRVDGWSDDIAAGVAELRARGCRHVTVVGLRLGALVSARVAPDLDVDRFVAWVPVTSGRRYSRELRMLSIEAPEGEATVGDTDTRYFAGTALTGELLADLGALSVDQLTGACPATLVVDRTDKPSAAPFVSAMEAAGSTVEHVLLDGAESMLDEPTEYATVPTAHLDAIAHWLADVHRAPIDASEAPFTTSATLDVDGVDIVEEVLSLGPNRLVAVEAKPSGEGAPTGETIVFLNTGSEHHTGSGRVWVELSRQLAARGKTALRVDFRGFGESPSDGFAPGRPYDAHTVDDVRSVAAALSERGDGTVVLAGICAGAWVALRECWTLPIAGVIAFNPQLYWQPGDPVEALMSETRARRTQERARDKRLGESGWWSALDTVGIRPPAGRWLDRIARSPFPVRFEFEHGDDGLDYLRDRLARRTAAATSSGSLSIEEFDGLDHPMHRHWRRHEALTSIERFLDEIRTTGQG